MNEPEDREAGVKGEVTMVELTRLERSAARRRAEARAIVPTVELACETKLDCGLELATARGVRPLSVVLAVLARRLRDHPRLNGAYRDGRYELYSRINLGVSMPGPDAPVIATLFDAAERSIDDLDSELSDLLGRAVAGHLSAAELSGSTFTVTPPAAEDVVLLTPLIQPPQAAVLAVGPWRQSPVVRSGELAAGWVSRLTLACDHRIVQAHLGAAFLEHLKRSLEAPEL